MGILRVLTREDVLCEMAVIAFEWHKQTDRYIKDFLAVRWGQLGVTL